MEITDEILACLRRMYNAPKMTKTAAQHKINAVRQFKNSIKVKKPI